MTGLFQVSLPPPVFPNTADSLEKLYQAFPNQRKIAVLGNTGGGRDTWKRPVMAEVADKYCNYIILTNEDPYDEDPREIINQMIPGIKNHKPEIIMDRRGAIEAALRAASPSSVVLITGKGTDPFIMGPNGSKTPWDDATVVREELSKLLKKK
jgi:UDP-N-acetylmuramoyl-L-alanyl-D-glutamate--2,6-diaminopimelate ligase